MTYTYEEIRSVSLDILSGREEVAYSPDQYEHLSSGVAEVLARREGKNTDLFGRSCRLGYEEREIFLEVFWDLFRQGITTLGCDSNNQMFPFFRVTEFGEKIAKSNSVYFFHDVSSYEKALLSEIPNINDVTLVYLKEAMQAFKSGCILSCSVMLGVATEHTFLLLLEIIENNSEHEPMYRSVFSQRTILQKINKFKNIIDQNSKTLSSDIKEDFDTHFASILSIIRNFRNQSGHPSGKIISREQAFVLLQLFIPYCKKLYQLKDHFS